jgi:phosphoheptose isomerase
MIPPTFQQSLDELSLIISECTFLTPVVEGTGMAILEALKRGNKLLTCGNGGSAADALHLAEELVGRYSRERRALAGLCLNSDPTAITCICNDYGYEHVFSRAVEALGKSGDVLVGITTSGNSTNVIKAFESAKKIGITTILLSGKTGGKALGICDYEIIVPSENTARIQEIHTLILHQWLEQIDVHDWGDVS